MHMRRRGRSFLLCSSACVRSLDESTQVEFKPFKNALQDGSSFRNAKAFTYAPAGHQQQ